MSGHEPGDPNNYPVEIALVDDATLPTAANINLGTQDLADRTAWLRARMVLPSMNFHSKVAGTLATVAKFDPTHRTWFGVGTGGDDRLVSTVDPMSWPGVTELSGANLKAAIAYDLAINAVGDLLAASNEFDTFWHRTAAGVITSAVGTLKVMVSTTPLTSFADAATPPAGMPNGDVTIASNGTTLLMVATSGTNLYTSTSTDGNTWSAPVVTALGFTPSYGPAGTRRPSPAWNVDTSKWILTVPDVTNGTTRIYTSNAMGTWTLAATLTTVAVSYIAAIGKIVCGVSRDGEIVGSEDGGASWRWADRHLSTATINSLAASAGRFLISQGTNGDLYPSMVSATGLAAVA